MQVLEYIREHGLDAVKDNLGIKVKEHECGLILLDYCQIDSPKLDPIVRECRSLIIDQDLNIVSRSFDRFFNLGETEEEGFDITTSVAYEKVDGSLIKIFNWRGNWYISTRGTIFADGGINGSELTFSDLVYKALLVGDYKRFNALCRVTLDPRRTYICEITARENRVVKRYTGYTLWFLACRENSTGLYDGWLGQEEARDLGCELPKTFTFDSVEAVMEASHGMEDLDEGYVLYDQNLVPKYKVKSPVYLAVHRIRGEGVVTPKRIMQLVVINEQDEYLNYFPEDRDLFDPYIDAFAMMKTDMEILYSLVAKIEDQKEFALKVKDHSCSACLFQARAKGITPTEVFHNQRESFKLNCLGEYKKRLEERA